MGTSVNPVINASLWHGLRAFVAGHGELLAPNSKIDFLIDIPKESGHGTEMQEVRMTFAYPTNANGVKIYGSTKSTIGIVSECKLDLEDNTGRITLPQFNSEVELSEEKCSIEVPESSHPDIYTFTHEALSFFQDVLDRFISGEDEKIQETLKEMMLRIKKS
ncbi:MAG: hypothetical protein HY094_06035 [Candidatus Melainabacteria bacterium]|nr:hypothetical protein [Candidatus Melainabacteria bacterium]